METGALVFPDQGRGFTRGVSERAPSLRSVDGFVRTPNVCFSFQFLRRAWNPAIVVDCAKFKNPDPRHRQNQGPEGDPVRHNAPSCYARALSAAAAVRIVVILAAFVANVPPRFSSWYQCLRQQRHRHSLS